YNTSRIARSRSPTGVATSGTSNSSTTSSTAIGGGSERASGGDTTEEAGSRSTAPSRIRNGWKDRTDDSARATDRALYGRSSSPRVDAEIDATKDRTVASSTSSGAVMSRFAQNAA